MQYNAFNGNAKGILMHFFAMRSYPAKNYASNLYKLGLYLDSLNNHSYSLPNSNTHGA